MCAGAEKAACARKYGRKTHEMPKFLKKAPKSLEIGKKRSELRKTMCRLRLREKGAHDIEGLCELHNSHLVQKRYEETCKTAAFRLVLHVPYAPIGCCELCKMMNQKGGENALQGEPSEQTEVRGLRGRKRAKKRENRSMQTQIDQKHRNIGRRHTADAGSLSNGGGTELGELLRRLDAESCYLTVVKGAWQLS